MSAIKFLALFLVFNIAHLAGAQVINTLPQAAAGSERYFLYEVKLVEEFIERFNDDRQSYIRRQCLSLYGTDSMITRRRLLKSLLDKKQPWGQDTSRFFNEITEVAHAQYLSFTDSNWYALARCIFMLNGKKVEIPVVLHIKTRNGASQWMIAGIGENDVISDKLPVLQQDSDTPTSSADFIPTSSYGTNFVILGAVFSRKMHVASYFEPQVLHTPRAQNFIGLVKQGKIRFEYVKSINYHFFQVKNWVFTVEQFRRKELNNGWLISELQSVDSLKKEALLKALLYQ